MLKLKEKTINVSFEPIIENTINKKTLKRIVLKKCEGNK